VIDTPNGRHFASTLALMLQFVGARFRAIVETRWVVEPGIAALAAERATGEDLAALRACLATMRAHLAQGARFQEENRRFHDLIAFASGNPVFRYLLPALHWISDGAAVEYSPAERRRIVRANRQILAAVEAGDATAAYGSMQRFFAMSLAYLDRTYPDVMARPVAWSDSEL
jgi:DNA-binding FadR family transcriptional regulator